jgi:hypothetical protein
MARNSNPERGYLAAKVGVAALATLGALGISGCEVTLGPTQTGTDIATLASHPSKAPNGNEYQVTFHEGGTIYGALEAIAKAEGHNPTALGVSEGLVNDSNSIAGKINPSGSAEVLPNQKIDVITGAPIVDPQALKDVASAETIQKVG